MTAINRVDNEAPTGTRVKIAFKKHENEEVNLKVLRVMSNMGAREFAHETINHYTANIEVDDIRFFKSEVEVCFRDCFEEIPKRPFEIIE